jgi:hypothetical protein
MPCPGTLKVNGEKADPEIPGDSKWNLRSRGQGRPGKSWRKQPWTDVVVDLCLQGGQKVKRIKYFGHIKRHNSFLKTILEWREEGKDQEEDSVTYGRIT